MAPQRLRSASHLTQQAPALPPSILPPRAGSASPPDGQSLPDSLSSSRTHPARVYSHLHHSIVIFACTTVFGCPRGCIRVTWCRGGAVPQEQGLTGRPYSGRSEPRQGDAAPVRRPRRRLARSEPRPLRRRPLLLTMRPCPRSAGLVVSPFPSSRVTEALHRIPPACRGFTQLLELSELSDPAKVPR